MLLDFLQESLEAPYSDKSGKCVNEVLQVKHQSIQVVKLIRPGGKRAS